MDNQIAIAYVNNYEGCHNEKLHEVARQIWQFCEERGIYIRASYITSKDNAIADFQSRAKADDSDWELNPKTFRHICDSFGHPSIDLFATHFQLSVRSFALGYLILSHFVLMRSLLNGNLP